MLSGVTRETRVLCSKLCSTGGIMPKLWCTKMTLPPHPPPPHRPVPINKHSNYSVKHFMSKRKVGNCEALKGLLYVFLQ